MVYRDIGGARRELLHQSVAEALERRGEGETHERDAQLAGTTSALTSGRRRCATLSSRENARQTLFAMRDALHWLDRAVALCDVAPGSLDERQRLAIYERRGAARAQAGQTQGAVADIRRVVECGARRRRTRKDA